MGMIICPNLGAFIQEKPLMLHLSFWIEAFAGLGLFLFGMLYLESQIKASAGRAFKYFECFSAFITSTPTSELSIEERVHNL